jgi:KipI family sensor histidine kinase inhibitor
VTIRPASDRALLISFGAEPGEEAQAHVAGLTRALLKLRGVLNLHPAFSSLLIDFDPRFHTHADMEALVRKNLETAAAELTFPARRIQLPVRYGGAGGPDLEDVARHASLSAAQVVERFSSVEYAVAFVGFATCFPYLTGLPAELATPRLAAPRKRVPAGSVAIGGSQAGVYPLASPGGWRLIGRTEVRLFDPAGEPPALLRMGDRVRFVPL